MSKLAARKRKKAPWRRKPRVQLDDLSLPLRRELLRMLLRDEFAAFLRMVFRTLHPNEPYLHNWHIDLLCATASACGKSSTCRHAR